MDFSKLAPWNWFKDEETSKGEVVPVKRNDIVPAQQEKTVLDIQNDFNELFDSLRKNIENSFGSLKVPQEFQNDWFRPSLDISSSGKNYTVKLELPGVDIKDIDIEITENTMKIKGEKKQEREEKDKDFYRIERSYGSFQRVLNLPQDSDIDKIESTHKDGVLSIVIPKMELPKSEVKTIDIKGE